MEIKKVHFFVEGITDLVFIKQYISTLFTEISFDSNDYKYEVISERESIKITNIKGWNNLFTEAMTYMLDNNQSSYGITNLLILDADNDYGKRKGDIEAHFKANNLDVKLFLFPNNKDNGDLETLLVNIINENNVPIFDCWGAYEECLKDKSIENRDVPLTIPMTKTKISAYIEALVGESEKQLIEPLKRDYLNTSLWNLEAEYLNPLSKFIKDNLQE